jgi:hypothetical protein
MEIGRCKNFQISRHGIKVVFANVPKTPEENRNFIWESLRNYLFLYDMDLKMDFLGISKVSIYVSIFRFLLCLCLKLKRITQFSTQKLVMIVFSQNF